MHDCVQYVCICLCMCVCVCVCAEYKYKGCAVLVSTILMQCKRILVSVIACLCTLGVEGFRGEGRGGVCVCVVGGCWGFDFLFSQGDPVDTR